jgi:hypothetical protein
MKITLHKDNTSYTIRARSYLRRVATHTQRAHSSTVRSAARSKWENRKIVFFIYKNISTFLYFVLTTQAKKATGLGLGLLLTGAKCCNEPALNMKISVLEKSWDGSLAIASQMTPRDDEDNIRMDNNHKVYI